MLILAITHPDTVSRSPRSLSEGGRLQAYAMARRLRELIGKKVVVGRVISSPKARCLETAIIVAKEIGETTREDGGYDQIAVKIELEELPGAAKEPEVLDMILRKELQGNSFNSEKAILLSVHGDLANMLSRSIKFPSEIASGGWFDVRPVLAVLEYQDSSFIIHHCETFQMGRWIPCTETT